MLALAAGRDPLDTEEGHSRYVRAHATAATLAGYRPEIFCVAERDGTRETELGTVHLVSSPRPRRQLLIGVHGPRLAAAIEARARGRRDPTVIHGFGVWGDAAVRARTRLRERGQRAAAMISSYTTHTAESASQVRGLDRAAPLRLRASFRAQAAWSDLVVSRYERRAYLGADALFVNYAAVGDLIRSAHGARVAVRRLPYGLDRPDDDNPEAERPPEVAAQLDALEPRSAPLVVCVASHHPRKGIDVLVRALGELRGRGAPVRAVLIGQGPQLEQNRACAAALGLAGTLAILPSVDDVDDYLRAADIFVLPSREEQSGSLAVLEALRLGVAVVASGVDGITEDLADRDTGLLTTPGDGDSLSAAIAELAADPALRGRLAAAGRERYLERFGAERFAAALGAAYSELGLLSA